MIPARRMLATTGLTVAALLCATASAHAQHQPERIQIRGAVFDQSTFGPVSGVLVEVPGLKAATATDSLGNFLLDLPIGPGYRLSVGRLGYESTGVVVLASEFHLPVMISIAADPVMLEGLTIVVDRFKSRRRSSMAIVRTIDSERLARWGSRNMLSVLRTRIPFLFLCPSDPFEYCTRSRGRTVRVRVCLDEFRAYGGVEQLAAYPPSAMHLIEVYRDRGVFSIRAYTRRFVERLTRNPRRLRSLLAGC